MLPGPSTQIRTTTRPQTTAHLAQTMTLLELSAAELLQRIESELASNPALELVDDLRCPMCGRKQRIPGPCPACSWSNETGGEEPLVFVSTKADQQFGGSASSDEWPEDNESSAVENLATYVLRQIAPELAVNDRPIAVHLLTGLDDDGLLTTPLIEIAQFHHRLPSDVERVRKMIQKADPVGVASDSPKEALLVQLEMLSESQEVPDSAAGVIEQALDELTHRRFAEVGRKLGIPQRVARQVADFIGENLNPYPARAHWGNVRQKSEAAVQVYQRPDVIISQPDTNPDGPLMVEILMPIGGHLHINPMFRKALDRAPQEQLATWRQDLDKAQLLVKCLRQRNNTMVRLLRILAQRQRQFILRGDRHLIPMTRASLAQYLEVHESTISRAVANKNAQLPNGRMIPLKLFFDRSLHIRTVLKEIIEDETAPLSDSQIAGLLAEAGLKVARRTVAKYRAMESIPPTHMRAHLRTKSQNQRNGRQNGLYAGARA